MPRRFLTTLLIIGSLLILLPASVLGAGFAYVGLFDFSHERYYPGARTAALGSADLATANGPMAILHNPAAQREGHTTQLGLEKSKWAENHYMINWGLAGQWKRFRIGLVHHELAARDLVLRTAYAPEGTGETFEIIRSIWVVGLSAEVLPGQWIERGLSVVVGGNWRKYAESSFLNEGDGDDADLGVTVSWRRDLADGWLSLSGAAMKHNIYEATLDWHDNDLNERSPALPYYSQQGVTLTRAWLLPDGAREALRVLVAYSHRNETREEDRETYHADRWGVEMVAVEMLSFRWGDSDDSMHGGMTESMGLGLTIPRRLIDPVQVQLDWTHFDKGRIGGWESMYALTVAVNF